MKYGYARVSTDDQNADAQVRDLEKAGCEKVFTDVISGSKRERASLDAVMAAVTSGDVLVVWKLDRLGRSLGDLKDIVSDLKARGVGFQSLHEAFDTTTPAGKLFFHMLGAFAEFERDIIIQRTKAGLETARRKGRTGGRKRVTEPQAIRDAAILHNRESVCRMMKISEATYFRAMKGAA
jgi:DNA invertase Pin-like site-specific DNA recombinase